MLRCIAQDSKRDFDTTGGRLNVLTGLAAAMQIIDNTVRSQLREYRYNQTKGIDYTGNVFAGNPNFQLFESQLRTNITDLDFVVSIESIEYNLDNDIFTYTLTVRTDYGTDTVNGEA